jgi:ATP-dependent protease HslVU (ClpYQ) peptidase subunit
MTCIIGLLDNGVAYMGADSFGSNGYVGQVYKNKKVFKLDKHKDILMGYTTSFRMGQLLQYSESLFDELNLLKDDIDEKYMVNKFIPNVKKLFKQGEYGKPETGGNFLLTFKDKLYEIQDDFSILEPKDKFVSVGCGENFAMASLTTSQETDKTPIERITDALIIAEKYATGVRRPFYILNNLDDEIIEIL